MPLPDRVGASPVPMSNAHPTKEAMSNYTLTGADDASMAAIYDLADGEPVVVMKKSDWAKIRDFVLAHHGALVDGELVVPALSGIDLLPLTFEQDETDDDPDDSCPCPVCGGDLRDGIPVSRVLVPDGWPEIVHEGCAP